MANVPAPPGPYLPQIPPRDDKQLWPEPLDTPGLVPYHMKRSATAAYPYLEVIQRLLYRFRLGPGVGEVEKVLALIGLYQTLKPLYKPS